MKIESTFEVLLLRDDRWELQEVFASEVEAMHAAHALQQRPNTRGVQIVRDRYDRTTGLSRGTLVFERRKSLLAENAVRSSGAGGS
ncbi:MAG: hypothetical protein KDE35_17730 [Geminicoccaceae bacterium]|nr:hypothetical protein [Geminicoccaceae bacterium]